MILQVICFMICLFIAGFGHAKSSSKKSKVKKHKQQNEYFFEPLAWGLGVGNYTEFVGDIQVNTEADTNKFDFVPYLNTNLELRLYKSFSWRPELAMTLPKSEESDAIKTTVYMIRSDFAYSLSAFKFLIGPGYFVTKISGDGGTMQLNNGTNGNQTFYLPSETSYASNYTLDIGVEVRFDANKSKSNKRKRKNIKINTTDSIGFKAQAHVFSLLNSEKRQWAYTISLNYFFSSKGGWSFF